MVLFHKRTEWANFWYAYEEDALTLCRVCGHDPKTYGLSFIPLSDGSRGYPIMIFTDEFGKPGLSKIPPEILDENCVVVEKDMQAQPQSEPREAGIGREPQGQEAKCRLAPSWVANRVLPHGFRVLCFSSYHNGDFSISVENKEGCRILTKDEFRKLCSEPPQSPTTSTDIQTIKPQEKRAQTARKEPKRTIKIFLQVQRPAYHFREVTKMVVPRLVKNVPRECSTAVMPHGSPPIRGDCAIINFLTKQSTRYG